MEFFFIAIAPPRRKPAPPRSGTRTRHEKTRDVDDAAPDAQFTPGSLSDFLRHHRRDRHGGDSEKCAAGHPAGRALCPSPGPGGSIVERLFAPPFFFRDFRPRPWPVVRQSAHGLANFALSKRND